MRASKRPFVLLMAALAAFSMGCETAPTDAQVVGVEKVGAEAESRGPEEADGAAMTVDLNEVPLQTGRTWSAEAFAEQWQRLSSLPDGFEKKETLAKEMERRWSMKKVRWTGATLAGLCLKRERRCAMNTFDKARISTRAAASIGGFAPLVNFSPSAWAKIEGGCGGQPQCVVTFTGLIEEVVTEPGRPLTLKFAQAIVETTRQAEAEEVWFGRTKATAPKPVALGAVRTGKKTIPALKIKPKTF